MSTVKKTLYDIEKKFYYEVEISERTIWVKCVIVSFNLKDKNPNLPEIMLESLLKQLKRFEYPASFTLKSIFGKSDKISIGVHYSSSQEMILKLIKESFDAWEASADLKKLASTPKDDKLNNTLKKLGY